VAIAGANARGVGGVAVAIAGDNARGVAVDGNTSTTAALAVMDICVTVGCSGALWIVQAASKLTAAHSVNIGREQTPTRTVVSAAPIGPLATEFTTNDASHLPRIRLLQPLHI
jgi:hypothetical protein